MYTGSIMPQECYELKNHILKIVDPELELYIEESCILPSFSTPHQMEGLFIKEEMYGIFRHIYHEYNQLLHGEYQQYDESDSLFSSTFYSKGEMHGPSLFFTKDGECLAKSWFYHGVLQGKAYKYYLNGKIYSIQRYRNGLMDGKQEFFYEDGSIKTLLNYTHGYLDGLAVLFWKNGMKKREATFIQGNKQGNEQIWDESGKLIDSGEYEMGKKVSL